MAYLSLLGWLVLLSLGLVEQAQAQAAPKTPPATCLGAELDDGAPADAGAREVACLRELRGLASRHGELLTVKLDDGTSKTYRSDPKACESDDAQHCIHYWLVSYHPWARVYSIEIQYYEGSAVELVSARTGNVLRLPGEPHFSPDGSRFVVIDNDYAYGGEYDLSVGSAANGSLALEWQHKSEGAPLEWHLQRWGDNDHVALRAFSTETYPADTTCPKQDCDAVLVRIDNDWTVRRLPGKQP